MRPAAGVLVAAVAAVTALLAAVPSASHPARVAQADISIGERAVDVRLSLNLLEADLLLSLDADLSGAVDERELAARRDAVAAHLRERVAVTSDGAPLALDLGSLALGRGGDGRATLEAHLRFAAERGLGRLAIRCEPLADLGDDHTTIARIAVSGRHEEFAFRRGTRWEGGGGARSLKSFLGLGVSHIVAGFDHLAFLVGLAAAGASLAGLVKTVTAFTVAHSLTLSLAALDLVRVPAALVEAGIAVSVMYVAAANFLRDGGPMRWVVAFAFGLLHGLGFAEALREAHLEGRRLALSLLAFNVGVELAQIVLVVAVVAALAALGRAGLERAATRLVSVAIFSLGAVWLYQRLP